jgi:hypothetical protein
MQRTNIHALPGKLLPEILTHLSTDDVISFLTTSNELFARTASNPIFAIYWNNYWLNSINLHFNNVGNAMKIVLSPISHDWYRLFHIMRAGKYSHASIPLKKAINLYKEKSDEYLVDYPLPIITRLVCALHDLEKIDTSPVVIKLRQVIFEGFSPDQLTPHQTELNTGKLNEIYSILQNHIINETSTQTHIPERPS